MRELAKTLKMLSDESRLRVLNLLMERECCVCEVMQAMEISQSKTSRILNALYDAGLLKLRREGRWALYSIAKDETKPYVDDILSGVTKALAGNMVTTQDRERLKKAERVGPGCACQPEVTKLVTAAVAKEETPLDDKSLELPEGEC